MSSDRNEDMKKWSMSIGLSLVEQLELDIEPISLEQLLRDMKTEEWNIVTRSLDEEKSQFKAMVDELERNML